MTREAMNAINGQTLYTLADRKLQMDGIGRGTKLSFYSPNRTGYLNLDTYQKYLYDSTKHRLTGIQREATSQSATAIYDDATGRVTKTVYGTGARTEIGYDASGGLTKVAHFSATGTKFASNAYEYDAAGVVTRMVLDDDLASGATGDAVVTYEYDALYRLTREVCTVPQGSSRTWYDWRYFYDAAGNRTKYIRSDPWTTNRTAVYEYSPRNELTRYSDPEGLGRYWVLQYDLRGNLTKRYHTYWTSSWMSYEWDSRNLLTKVYRNDTVQTIELKYDSFGRRVAKRVNGGAWRWHAGCTHYHENGNWGPSDRSDRVRQVRRTSRFSSVQGETESHEKLQS